MLKIFCAHCKEHIYNYTGNIILTGDYFCCDWFKPANKKIKQPEIHERMICPLCKKYFLREDRRVLTDKGFLPK